MKNTGRFFIQITGMRLIKSNCQTFSEQWCGQALEVVLH